MSETLPYEVLKPIAYKGDRIEKGSVIHMTPEEAENIGDEYLQPAEEADEKDIPSEQSEEKESDESKDDEPSDLKDSDAADTEKKEGDESSSLENKTDDTQTDNKSEENI